MRAIRGEKDLRPKIITSHEGKLNIKKKNDKIRSDSSLEINNDKNNNQSKTTMTK